MNRQGLVSLLVVCSLACFGDALAGRKHGDVENIGNRNINGRVALIFPNFVSLEREIQIGQQYAQYFEQTARLVEDPVVQEYVDRVGQNIVKHSDAKVPFVIKVVDTDEVNAFALPGGYFYVNKGLILEADNETELAGVMAHEIAHVAARHATERMTKSQLMQFAAFPALFVGGYWTQTAIYNGLGMGLSLAVLGITRKSEAEADQLGTQYLWNSGYDPYGFVTFFEKLQAREKDKPGKFASFWRTHPPVEDRIEKVQEEISYLPPKDEYVVSTSDFDRVKARLIALDSKLVAAGSQQEGGSKRPTLKRRTSTDRSEQEEPSLKQDRPSLKRPSLKKEADDDTGDDTGDDDSR
ncbi:MAG TPA: M48 family metallopeptidase [Acidobacteriota bacterium]|mgnify:FL=1|nr:M48 family metallopeptidase [Acidobacteriota bacterium]HRR27299.1 M48 family metallopeptidase [Acidobacteriota bacterium]HRV07867.1 M48 family metallopeptidase [Acidobacteriota bacterium]